MTAQSQPSASRGQQGRLRDDPDVRRYVVARSVSLTGSMVTYVAMPVLVYSLTQSTAWTAAVVAFEGLPYLLFGLFAGAVSDRVNRRSVMVATDLGSAVLLCSIPISFELGLLTPVQVLVVAFSAQTLFVFFDAANFGALPALAGRERLVSLSSSVFGIGSALEVAVPVAAGALLVWVSASELIAIDCITFVISALLVRSIVRPLSSQTGKPTASFGEDVRTGLLFLFNQPVVRTMTILGFLLSFTGGGFSGLMVAWADRVLDVQAGDERLGLIFGAWGVGSLVAAILLPKVVRRFGAAQVAVGLMPIVAGLALLTAVQTQWWGAALALAAWSTGFGMVVINAVTVRQLVTPAHLQSRVNTTGRMLSFGLGFPLGALIVGALAEILPLQQALLVSTFSMVLAAVLTMFSPLRGADIEAMAAAIGQEEADLR